MSKTTSSAAAKQRDYDYLFKLVLIGDSGVGKSCLLLRFAVSIGKLFANDMNKHHSHDPTLQFSG